MSKEEWSFKKLITHRKDNRHVSEYTEKLYKWVKKQQFNREVGKNVNG